MKELDEMIATATRLREIIAKVERSADEAQQKQDFQQSKQLPYYLILPTLFYPASLWDLQ